MEDLPAPPSPQMVMEMGTGGCEGADGEMGEETMVVVVVVTGGVVGSVASVASGDSWCFVGRGDSGGSEVMMCHRVRKKEQVAVAMPVVAHPLVSAAQ